MNKSLLLFCLILLPFRMQGQSPAQTDNKLRVKGTYITKEIPEQIDFSVFIRYSNPGFKACSDSLLIIARDLTEVLVDNGIERDLIKVSNIAVHENYIFSGGSRIREGFTGSATIEIQSIFSQVFSDRIFTALGSVNYDLSYNVRFSLSEEQKGEIETKAIRKAIEDAMNKAEIIAERSNMKLARINRIIYDDNAASGIIYSADNLARHEMLSDRDAPAFSGLDLNPKEISISRSIMMEWWITE